VAIRASPDGALPLSVARRGSNRDSRIVVSLVELGLNRELMEVEAHHEMEDERLRIFMSVSVSTPTGSQAPVIPL